MRNKICGAMSKDLPPESPTFKEDVNLYRYCNGNLNFSTVSRDDDDFAYQKKKIMRDPMSHRIIEKRRRDRMNNCLADLSRLIPPGYLKKGRGRIEKTEIIEMAIKHMRHLQNIISSSRMMDGRSEIQTGSSPERGSRRDCVNAQTVVRQNPIVLEHYRLGYLECLSEAMHFLVEVQGYFAGDSLCVQMINHLHKHCDKILRSESLDHPRKHGGDTASSTSSTSPPNGSYGDNSPPLGLSVSDDNQSNLPYENVRSPRRYSDVLSLKKNRNYSRYSEHESERISENHSHSDSDPEQGYSSNGRNREIREYVNGCRGSPTCSECVPKDSSSSSGIGSIPPPLPPPSDEFLVKEENGPSQLRDMLTSPRALHIGHPIRDQEMTKISSPPQPPPPPPPIFGCDVDRQSFGSRGSCPCPGRDGSHCRKDVSKYKNSEGEDPGTKEFHNESAPDTSGNMYKFKNNIKQRFSKERKNHESDEEGIVKKLKLSESGLGREGTVEEDYKRCRFISESETQTETEDISNRLGFGHKIAGSKSKERTKYSKLSSPEIPIYYKPGENGRKPERLLSINEYLPPKETLFHKNDLHEGMGIPIFALHAKGAFYIPLTLDHTVLAPFLSVLGLTKSEEIEDKPVLHPISISVNFQSPFLSNAYRQSAVPWKVI